MIGSRILYFTSPTCQPCKVFKPVVEKFCGENGLHFQPIDFTDDPSLFMLYKIRSTPTCVFVDDRGGVVNQRTGVMSPKELQEFVV